MIHGVFFHIHPGLFHISSLNNFFDLRLFFDAFPDYAGRKKGLIFGGRPVIVIEKVGSPLFGKCGTFNGINKNMNK